MSLTEAITMIESQLATLDVERARLVAALTALRGDTPPATPTTAPAVRQARPPAAPDAEDDTRALLKALRTLGGPAPTSAIEIRAKTGLANISLRRRLMALVDQGLVLRTGEGAGTCYAARS